MIDEAKRKKIIEKMARNYVKKAASIWNKHTVKPDGKKE